MAIVLGTGRESGRDWGIVSALPSGAHAGDVCTYKAAAGVYWRLTYTGEETYPWAKIGGPPLMAPLQTAVRELTNQLTYASLPTDPLELTLALKGDYDIEIQAIIQTPATAFATGFYSYAIGATAATESWGEAAWSPTAAETISNVVKRTRQTGVAAGSKVIDKGRTGGNYKIIWVRRRLIVDPVRVG